MVGWDLIQEFWPSLSSMFSWVELKGVLGDDGWLEPVAIPPSRG